jgi:hypothetical protein
LKLRITVLAVLAVLTVLELESLRLLIFKVKVA